MRPLSLGLAKKLRDKGYSRKVYHFYKNGLLEDALYKADFNRFCKENLVSAPFHDEVREFLREEYTIFVDPYYSDSGWSCKVRKGLLDEDEYSGFDSYEECLEYVFNEQISKLN